jgi:S-adenosylmethionine decarboxylase
MIRREQPILYTADLAECQSLSALDHKAIAAAFSGALRSAGASVVHEVSHEYPGHGLTCVLVLRESHAVLHTWPETGTVNIDIFSCSAGLKCYDAIAEIGRLFGAGQVSVQEIPRADGHSLISPRARD